MLICSVNVSSLIKSNPICHQIDLFRSVEADNLREDLRRAEQAQAESKEKLSQITYTSVSLIGLCSLSFLNAYVFEEIVWVENCKIYSSESISK